MPAGRRLVPPRGREAVIEVPQRQEVEKMSTGVAVAVAPLLVCIFFGAVSGLLWRCGIGEQARIVSDVIKLVIHLFEPTIQ